MKEKRKGGAEPKFDFNDKENLLRIEGWARDGLDDKNIAKNIGYNDTYFCELKKKHSELSKALKKGRAPLDIIVESTMYRKAVGMKIKRQQAIKLKRTIYEDGKRIDEEYVEKVELEEDLPPDTVAMIFWLKNRKPEHWRDRVNNDITTNGKDVGTQLIFSPTPLSEKDMKEIMEIQNGTTDSADTCISET